MVGVPSDELFGAQLSTPSWAAAMVTAAVPTKRRRFMWELFGLLTFASTLLEWRRIERTPGFEKVKLELFDFTPPARFKQAQTHIRSSCTNQTL